MTAAGPLISIVFSFRNEAANIPELVARIDKVFATQPEDYELIFVNDQSSDDSVKVLLEQRRCNARIKIVNMSRRFGVSECVRAGMAKAMGEATIYMDADLQDPPEVIPHLLERWREGAQVVHTVRVRRDGESHIKMWLTKQAYRAIRAGSTITLPIEAGDFKLLSRNAVSHLLQLRETDPYLRGLVVWIGFSQVAVPYERAPRHAGDTHFPLFSRNPWKTLIAGLTSFSFTPIYVCGILAVAGFCAAVLALVGAVVAALLRPSAATGIAIVGFALFLWATMLGAISAVGVYVIRIYKDVRGRPQYIIESSVGFED